MTRKEELEERVEKLASRLGNGLACSRSHPHEDMNQICELQTEVARMKNELTHWSWVRFKQLEEENTKLRAALVEIVEKCEDEDWEYMFGDILIQAKQALKEVS